METNNLTDMGIAHTDTDSAVGFVYWNDERLASIIRIRLLTDRTYPAWDVSYVLGKLTTGEQVRVRVPFHQLPKRGSVRMMVDYAKRDGVFLRGLCGGDIEDVVSRMYG